MKKITRRILAFASGILVSIFSLHAQSDSVQWVQGGILTTWYGQPDVFAFHCSGGGGMPCSIDTSIVAGVVHQWQRSDQAIEIYFKPGAAEADKELLKMIIRGQPQFEQEFLSVTRNAATPWENQQWYVLDDQLLVNFKNPFISAAQVTAFATEHQLHLVSAPDPGLPAGGNYAYVFRMDSTLHGVRTVAEQALKIAGGDSSVLNVEPNFVNLRMPGSQLFSGKGDLLGAGPGLACPLSDSLYDWMWHIDNQGTFRVNWPGTGTTPMSTLDADADICECWQAGWTGRDIKIAVISTGGFDFNHPDVTTLQDGWDCSVVPCTLLNKTVVPADSFPYGIYASSLLVANPDNVTGISGMAEGALVFPIRIGDMSWSTVAAEAAINLALHPVKVNADIAVLNFWSPVPSEAIRIAIENNIQLGRPVSGGGAARGMVMIAPTGGDLGVDGLGYMYPALYDSVLSVIGSTPNDKIKRSADGWDLGLFLGPYGCYGGHWYDVAAPAACILGADYSDSTGLNNTSVGYGYALLAEQGYAQASVVAAIAAMVLEKRTDFNWLKVVNCINAGAEKVGGYAYTWPGSTSEQMAHGRVSCGNTLALIPVGTQDPALDANVQLWQDEDHNLIVNLSGLSEVTLVTISLSDITGKILTQWDLPGNPGRYSFPLPGLSTGLYLATAANEEVISARKIVIW